MNQIVALLVLMLGSVAWGADSATQALCDTERSKVSERFRDVVADLDKMASQSSNPCDSKITLEKVLGEQVDGIQQVIVMSVCKGSKEIKTQLKTSSGLVQAEASADTYINAQLPAFCSDFYPGFSEQAYNGYMQRAGALVTARPSGLMFSLAK